MADSPVNSIGTPIDPLAAAKRATGKRGEDLAAAYLTKNGYTIYARNCRLGRDEIDIIATDPSDSVLVFVEVKARQWLKPGFHPSIDATRTKRKSLQRSARAWVMSQNYQGGYRIDLICIAGGKVIDHIRELAWDGE